MCSIRAIRNSALADLFSQWYRRRSRSCLTLRNVLRLIAMGQTLNHALVACRRHQVPRPLASLEVPGWPSRASSAPRICSTCSSAEAEAAVHLAVDLVRAFAYVPDHLHRANTPPVFSASFGPSGFRTTQMGGGAPRQRGANANANTPSSGLVQLLPLLLLMLFSIINVIPGLFSTPATPDPRFGFSPSARYDQQRTTAGMGITYHVNSAELRSHPVLGPEIARGAGAAGGALGNFEGSVERAYTRELYGRCQAGMDSKERRKEREVGIFGLGADWEKVKQIEEEKVPECEELRRLGVIR